jgi:hypothetical protein
MYMQRQAFSQDDISIASFSQEDICRAKFLTRKDTGASFSQEKYAVASFLQKDKRSSKYLTMRCVQWLASHKKDRASHKKLYAGPSFSQEDICNGRLLTRRYIYDETSFSQKQRQEFHAIDI